VTDSESRLRRLGLMRIATGIIFLFRTTPLLAPFGIGFLEHTFPLFGWPAGFLRAPTGGLALPDGLVAALCIARTIAALAFTVGLFSRASGIAAGLLGYLVLSQDEFAYVQTLHLIFASTLLLGLTDCGSALAVRPERPRAPDSSLLLVQVWVASVYAWAGLAKLHADWLDGRVLAVFQEAGAIRGILADAVLRTPAEQTWAARAITAVEIGLGPALLLRHTRNVAVILAYALHLGIQIVARPDMFSMQMGVLLVSFTRINWHTWLPRTAMQSAIVRTSRLQSQAPETRTLPRHFARHTSFQ
jgi:hypothetical protein